MGSAQIDLVRSVQRGDALAFDRLLAPELDRLMRIASAILGNEADAGEAVQEALGRAWQKNSTLRDPGFFRTWLTRILINEARQILRARVSCRSVEEAAPAGSVTTERFAVEEAAVRVDSLERAFERLNPDQKAVLVLHYVADESVAGIASALRIREGTVKSRLFSARAALDAALAKEDVR